MSNYSDTNVSGPTSGEAPGSSGTLGTAKSEASDLAHTAGDEAKGVVDAAKTEATSVAQEAKSQAKDLFAQSQQELKDQARTQQQRVASGLQTVGGDLQSMADGAASDSLAAELVRQVSGRISSASAWLSDREPADVLDEVKRFARRRPGVFILSAAIAGVVVGRLTRALATNAAEAKKSDATGAAPQPMAPPVSDTGLIEPTVGGAADELSVAEPTPIYAQSTAGTAGSTAPFTEDGDVRRDSL
jgi:vacuolar-type H+-ATPase subunit H